MIRLLFVLGRISGVRLLNRAVPVLTTPTLPTSRAPRPVTVPALSPGGRHLAASCLHFVRSNPAAVSIAAERRMPSRFVSLRADGPAPRGSHLRRVEYA